MGLNLKYITGQTLIDEDEKADLLIPTISTQRELDEFEQQNIESAVQWTMFHSFPAEEILTERFVKGLHMRMFGDVWLWAGEFRRSNKNIGVDKYEIPVALRTLLDDVRFWITNATYDGDEIAVRFKHRLVFIHCFVNGNGRHARLMADVLAENVFDRPVFSWGRESLRQSGEARTAYLAALRAADAGDIRPLLQFARS
ncbi:MAG: mobile mystery protein B [Bacteroidetes bacterium]|nr:mobile mystery protein B [Bacteroidota bacterium]